MNYLHWDKKIITDFSDKNITEMYDRGYVFTRLGKGVMEQTRSTRVSLAEFEFSSENRRILKKIETVSMRMIVLPITEYDWKIAKLAKDFYEIKFGSGTMSANKIKEILTQTEHSNFNSLLIYSYNNKDIGYAICYQSNYVLHYSYPFYDLTEAPKDMGLGMINLAIKYAQENKLDHVYLGSLQRPNDTYKLQYSNLEWFDGKVWQSDISEVKRLLS